MAHRLRRTSAALTIAVGAAALSPALPAAAAAAAAAAPSVASLSVRTGPLGGGGRITVTGAHFARGATVKFGSAAGRSVSVSSSTRLSVAVPAHAAGIVDVRVTTTAGTSAVRTADHYRYVPAPTVTSLSPAQGLPDGGATITIRGTDLTSTTRVAFGSVRATSVTLVSARALTAVSPAHEPGPVDVIVANDYGRSRASTADRFTYRDAPAAVSAVRVADVTTTSVSLRWTASATADVTGVVVRRAEGSTAPATPTAGQAVATVPAGTNGVLDGGVAADRVYSYAAFAYVAGGPLYAAPAAITVATPHNSRPDLPTGLTTDATPAASSSCTVAPYCTIGSLAGGPLTLSARVSDPDGDAQDLTARFEFWDATGGGHLDILGPDDPAGVSGTVRGSGGIAFVRVGGSQLVDGHLYALSVVASDGVSSGASAGPAYLRYDSSAPRNLAVTSPDTTFRTDVAAHFHFVAQETTPAAGLATGLDHFAYSFTSAAVLAGNGGTHVPAGPDGTADIVSTPTTFGSQYLYVTAVDRAGNHAATFTFEFYVAG